MKLIWTQRVAIYLGGLTILGVLLYPPWRVTRTMPRGGQTVLPVRHGWIFAPPEHVERVYDAVLRQEEEAYVDRLYRIGLARQYARDVADAERLEELEAEEATVTAVMEKALANAVAGGRRRERIIYVETAELLWARLIVPCLVVAVATSLAVCAGFLVGNESRKRQ